MLRLTPVVKQILIACIVFYFGAFVLGTKNIFDLSTFMAMHFPMSSHFRPWQIITHMFMHDMSSMAHLIFNMLGLVTIGSVLEQYIGSKKFFILFMLSGFGSLALHTLYDAWRVYDITGMIFPSMNDLPIQIMEDKFIPAQGIELSRQRALAGIYVQNLVGASGAIYGVLIAYAVYFPNTELMFMLIPYPIKAKYLVPGLLLIDLTLGISGFDWDNIAHFAHIGGAVTGFILVKYWRRFDRNSFW